MSRLALLISVALNLYLLTNMVAARVDVSKSSASVADKEATSWPTQEIFAGSIFDAGSVRELNDALNGAGLPENAIRYVVASWLSSVGFQRSASEIETYWTEPKDRAISPTSARLERDRFARQQLLDTFGSAVREDPLFHQLFQPLGPEFAFLNTDEQVLVNRWRLGREGSQMPLSPTGQCQTAIAGTADTASMEQHGLDELLGLLGEDSAFELQLRISPQAKHLRTQNLHEEQFRQAFSLTLKLTSDVEPEIYWEVRQELRELLGDIGFERHWSRYDPNHRILEQSLLAQGVSQALIDSAYSVVQQAQEDLLYLGLSNLSTPQRAESSKSVFEVEKNKLNSLLGVQVTREYYAARSRFIRDGRGRSLC